MNRYFEMFMKNSFINEMDTLKVLRITRHGICHEELNKT